MKDFKVRAFFGIVGLAAAGFLATSVTTTTGCGSDSKGGSTGSAGSTGSGGTTGVGGTTGTGGSNSGGSGGGGGASAALGCQASDLPAGDPLIADFMSTDGGAVVLAIGGTYVYPGMNGPVATVVAGGWNIKATTTGMTGAQYWGAGIYFNGNAAGTDCVDATAHTGIKFDISGTVTGTMCSVQYAANDAAHADMTVGTPPDPKAAGPAGSYAPQAQLTTISATPQTIMMPFSGTGAPTGGSPAIGIDKSKMTGVQWQFTTGAGTTSACVVDITIDNVMFY